MFKINQIFLLLDLYIWLEINSNSSNLFMDIFFIIILWIRFKLDKS